MECAVGIDLGGSSVKAVAVTGEGQAIATRTAPFEDDPRKDWARAIQRLVRELRREIGDRAVSRTPPNSGPEGLQTSLVGLSAPGLAAPDSRSIAHMPGRLHGLEGLDWTEFLHCDEMVPVLNDGHAALLGEAWLGAARNYRNVIMLTLGTGVGGAAIVDGRLLRGHIGRAGHLGHESLDPGGPADVVGTPGTLELAIGNCTIRERTGGRFQTTHDVVAAHAAGDPQATQVWLTSLRALARAIASFVNILDPQAVVIGGGIARAGDRLFDPLRTLMKEVEWRPGGRAVQLVPAQLGALAGAYGAAWNALEQGRKQCS
jgi:glucokinase